MMRPVWLFVLGLAACGERSPRLHTAELPNLPESAVAQQTPGTSNSASIEAAASAPVVVKTESAAKPPEASTDPSIGAPLVPPAEAACFFRGTGDPFANGCVRGLEVSSDRRGAVPLAQFDSNRVDITWAFFKGKGRAWVGVRSAGLTLTGFTDVKSERFRLARQATVIENHIWFHDQASVIVRAGTEHGVDLGVDDDTTGVERLVAHESCDALSFDMEPVARIPTAPLSSAARARVESPVRGVLPLRIEPEGRVITTLVGSEGLLPLSVEVKQVLGDYKRVEFDTKSAHFDVWVRANDVEGGHGFGIGGIGIGRCGSRPIKTETLVEVIADAPVSVGRTPLAKSPEGLTISHGIGVRVEKRENGFARIVTPFGAISPLRGAFFWIPESALEAPAP